MVKHTHTHTHTHTHIYIYIYIYIYILTEFGIKLPMKVDMLKHKQTTTLWNNILFKILKQYMAVIFVIIVYKPKYFFVQMVQLAKTVEYTNCTSAEG